MTLGIRVSWHRKEVGWAQNANNPKPVNCYN